MNRPTRKAAINETRRRTDQSATKEPQRMRGSFDDVKRKCHLWLMKNDPIYARNSRAFEASKSRTNTTNQA